MMINSWTAERRAGRANSRLLWRTTLPVISVGVLLLAVGVYGAWRVHRLHKRGSDILAENVTSIRAAEELESVARKLRYRLKRFLSTENERHLGEITALLPDSHRWLTRAEQLAKTEREQQLVTQLRLGFRQFTEEFERVVSAATATEQTRIADRLADDAIPNGVLAFTQQYIQLNEEQLADSNKRNQVTANQLKFGLLALGTCGGVTGLLAGYIIARRVSRTIVQLSLPIQDAAGKLDKVVGPIAVTADPSFEDLESVLRTVSQRVTMIVERLQESEREMLRAEQLAAVGQLAAGLAHELRNPLTSLKTILQLADAPDELTQQDLNVLKQEITRLEEAVQAFLDFARPPQPEKRSVCLERLIDEARELVARRAERQGIQFECHLPDEPVAVIADATQVRQVVLNLILNAFDAVPHGGSVRLDVSVEHEHQATVTDRWRRRRMRHVVVRVTDSGPGLPAELGDRIFDPFVSTKESGTGLGLSICRRIMEVHGGEIVAENGERQGAVLTARLPLAPPQTSTPRDRVDADAINRG